MEAAAAVIGQTSNSAVGVSWFIPNLPSDVMRSLSANVPPPRVLNCNVPSSVPSETSVDFD